MSNDSTISFEESYTSSYHKDCGECMTCVVSTTGSAVGWLDNQDQLIEIINAKAGQSGGDSSQESQYLDSQISSTKNDSLIDISSVDLDISTEECIRLWNRCSWQGQPDGRLVAITTDGIDKGDSASNSSNNLGLNSEASQWQETSQATTWDELSGDNDYIAGLMYGIKWRTTDPDDNNAAKELKYYFFNEEETIDGTWGSEPYQQEINAAIKAHNSFEEVGNLKFTEASTSNEAAIRWAFIDNEDAELATGSGGILGYAYMPGAEGYSGHIGINQDQYASPDNDQENLNPDPVSPGSYYHITFTHELGHALGLKHPHDSINTNPVFPGVDSPWDTGDNGLNATPWSVMTYNDVGANEYAPSFDAIGTYEGYLTGLGAFDIAAIQYLYGANNSFNTGDNIYSIDDTLDGFKSIWDAGGVDTIDGSSSSKRVTIDLRSATLKNQPGGGGFVSRINEEFKGYTIAYNSNGDAEIENANGSSFNDLIIGNEVNNILHGRDGNDNFFGGKGNDKIYGGNSFDTAEFTGEITDYNFVLDAINDLFKVSDSTLERDGEDSLSSVESIIFNQKQYEFPTDITLSATSFDENLDIGTTISTLTATDLDSLDQHTYSFVSGTESEANNFFRISGNQLILNDIADYETKDQYSIRIAATDADGLAIAKSFSLQVNDTDEANYNIDLSRTFLDEGDTLNTTVSTTDVDLGTELFWALEGNNFTQEDLRIGSLTGSNQVGADGNFSVSHTFAEDLTTEGLESLIVKLFSDQARQQLLAQSEAVQINDTSTSLEDGSGAVAFNYKLFSADSNQALDQLAVLGQGVDGTDRYKLEITAQSLLDQYNLESADVTLKFNPLIFQAINASDIQIGTDLPLANAVHIDNETGAVRIAASSLSDLAQGDGISSERLLASLTLDFDEGTLKTLGIQEDGSLAASPLIFEIEANQDETVFSRSYTEEDGSGLLNREIKSLADLGGNIHVDGTEVKLYSAGINIYEVDDGLILGSQRVIGSDTAYTNLIRSGDTITATTEWLNVGNTDANNIQVTAYDNANAQLSDYHFVDDISSVKSGRYVKGQFDQSDRESFQLVTDIKITGAAGNVVDLSDGILSLQADDSDVFVNNKGSSNLITYQGDLNYDGRVSMKDLAYLNAGAARQQTTSENTTGQDQDGNGVVDASVAHDVDADFNGKIDLADLAVLDADWGKTLHNGDQDFHGSADLSWSELDQQGTTGDAAWDNDSFKDQNAIESSPDYVGSLESPTSTGVIGADGNDNANDDDMQADVFQDPLTL